jgi:hypothetical protein
VVVVHALSRFLVWLDRERLLEAIGESTFELWLAPLELVAVDITGALLVEVPAVLLGWVSERFGRLLAETARTVGRAVRIADERERLALTGAATAVEAADVYRQATNRRVS